VKFVINACRRIGPDEADWSVVSIVDPCLGFRMNQLHKFNPRGFKDEVCRQIGASELSGAPAVGSIGFAVQVIKRRFFWRPYLELLIRGSPNNPIRKVFADHYKPARSTPRPVYVRSLDKAALLIEGASNNDMAKVGLEDDQWRQIAPLLHKWTFSSRLICQNWRVADCARSSQGIAKRQRDNATGSEWGKISEETNVRGTTSTVSPSKRVPQNNT
jgi:hypothetical protein